MSIYSLKPRFQSCLRPLTRKLYDKGVTANQVTLAACAVSVAAGILLSVAAFYRHPAFFYCLPVWLFVRMALNAVDGMLAREFGQKSDLGGYLNEITDVVSDAFLLLPFVWIAPFAGWQIACIAWLAALTEFCGVLGAVNGNGRRYDGPMGKSDRAFVFGLLGLVYAYSGSLPAWLYWAAYLLIGLLIWTCRKRITNGLGKI